NKMEPSESRCGVCEQVLTDPVSITCGHSFCRRCINSFRNRTALSEDFICPCCRKRSTTLPRNCWNPTELCF
uniref:RING-type domain-containing protein n=1 Tax=Astyanax mexicanus TaxID=7994 RepID=A0A3B1II75_ASTMX